MAAVVRAGSRGFGGRVGVGWPARREGREAAVEDLVAGQEGREEAVGGEGIESVSLVCVVDEQWRLRPVNLRQGSSGCEPHRARPGPIIVDSGRRKGCILVCENPAATGTDMCRS
jgi:hypothetical protein